MKGKRELNRQDEMAWEPLTVVICATCMGELICKRKFNFLFDKKYKEIKFVANQLAWEPLTVAICAAGMGELI